MDPGCVSLVAGAGRSDRLRAEGLLVNRTRYRMAVLSPDDSSAPSDLVVVTVKHHQLSDAMRDMSHRIGEQTLIMSLMNGVDSEEQIGAVYGADKVLYAVALGMDPVKRGNVITCANKGKILFGEAKNRKVTERVRRVQVLFDRAGIAYQTPQNMISALWSKFMFNTGINQASAVLRATYGVFQTSHEARKLMESAMREVMALAGKMKIHLSETDVAHWYGILSKLDPRGKTSMLQDVEARRKTEVEIFAGKVIELGKRYVVPTPVNPKNAITIGAPVA
jgi:2-dehydropantoate 2-reductase